jgi:small subunit ribosomal protein S9
MATSYIWGTGRRKSAVARVRLSPGTGKTTVNDRPIEKYFATELDRISALEPLRTCNRTDKYDLFVQVEGSGPTGQAGAIKLGLARALQKAEAELNPLLKQHKYLTRDPRMKERKKYGLHGARRGQQYSKR